MPAPRPLLPDVMATSEQKGLKSNAPLEDCLLIVIGAICANSGKMKNLMLGSWPCPVVPQSPCVSGRAASNTPPGTGTQHPPAMLHLGNTHRAQSTAMISVISSVGSPTEVSTMTMVTSPDWGIPAAPMLAAVAVMLQREGSCTTIACLLVFYKQAHLRDKVSYFCTEGLDWI